MLTIQCFISQEEEEHSRTPSHRETPLSTPTPTPEYTPPESEESAHDSPVIATPIRTPTPSVSSEEPTLSGSGDEEKVFEPIRGEQNKEEETGEQVCYLFGKRRLPLQCRLIRFSSYPLTAGIWSKNSDMHPSRNTTSCSVSSRGYIHTWAVNTRGRGTCCISRHTGSHSYSFNFSENANAGAWTRTWSWAERVSTRSV